MLGKVSNLFAARGGQFGLEQPNITDKLLGKFWNRSFDALAVNDFARGLHLCIGKRHVALFKLIELIQVVVPQKRGIEKRRIDAFACTNTLVCIYGNLLHKRGWLAWWVDNQVRHRARFKQQRQ